VRGVTIHALDHEPVDVPLPVDGAPSAGGAR